MIESDWFPAIEPSGWCEFWLAGVPKWWMSGESILQTTLYIFLYISANWKLANKCKSPRLMKILRRKAISTPHELVWVKPWNIHWEWVKHPSGVGETMSFLLGWNPSHGKPIMSDDSNHSNLAIGKPLVSGKISTRVWQCYGLGALTEPSREIGKITCWLFWFHCQRWQNLKMTIHYDAPNKILTLSVGHWKLWNSYDRNLEVRSTSKAWQMVSTKNLRRQDPLLILALPHRSFRASLTFFWQIL